MSNRNTRDDQGRERFTFPSHIRRDGSAVYPPLPGDEVVAQLKGWITPARPTLPPGPALDPRALVRTCIVCGAQVPAGKSEACPHE